MKRVSIRIKLYLMLITILSPSHHGMLCAHTEGVSYYVSSEQKQDRRHTQKSYLDSLRNNTHYLSWSFLALCGCYCLYRWLTADDNTNEKEDEASIDPHSQSDQSQQDLLSVAASLASWHALSHALTSNQSKQNEREHGEVSYIQLFPASDLSCHHSDSAHQSLSASEDILSVHDAEDTCLGASLSPQQQREVSFEGNSTPARPSFTRSGLRQKACVQERESNVEDAQQGRIVAHQNPASDATALEEAMHVPLSPEHTSLCHYAASSPAFSEAETDPRDKQLCAEEETPVARSSLRNWFGSIRETCAHENWLADDPCPESERMLASDPVFTEDAAYTPVLNNTRLTQNVRQENTQSLQARQHIVVQKEPTREWENNTIPTASWYALQRRIRHNRRNFSHDAHNHVYTGTQSCAKYPCWPRRCTQQRKSEYQPLMLPSPRYITDQVAAGERNPRVAEQCKDVPVLCRYVPALQAFQGYDAPHSTPNWAASILQKLCSYRRYRDDFGASLQLPYQLNFQGQSACHQVQSCLSGRMPRDEASLQYAHRACESDTSSRPVYRGQLASIAERVFGAMLDNDASSASVTIRVSPDRSGVSYDLHRRIVWTSENCLPWVHAYALEYLPCGAVIHLEKPKQTYKSATPPITYNQQPLTIAPPYQASSYQHDVYSQPSVTCSKQSNSSDAMLAIVSRIFQSLRISTYVPSWILPSLYVRQHEGTSPSLIRQNRASLSCGVFSGVNGSASYALAQDAARQCQLQNTAMPAEAVYHDNTSEQYGAAYTPGWIHRIVNNVHSQQDNQQSSPLPFDITNPRNRNIHPLCGSGLRGSNQPAGLYNSHHVYPYTTDRDNRDHIYPAITPSPGLSLPSTWQSWGRYASWLFRRWKR